MRFSVAIGDDQIPDIGNPGEGVGKDENRVLSVKAVTEQKQ